MAEPIEIYDGGSVERVAYDLMQQVNAFETSGITKDRSYWLTLYAECLRVVKGAPPK